MWEKASRGASNYANDLTRLGLDTWRDLTPAQYGGILIFVAVVGFLMMKSGGRI